MNHVIPSQQVKEYTYDLPLGRIASQPAEKRDESKLLVYKSGRIDDCFFTDLPQLVPPGTLMVFNNTKVIEARLRFQKPSGGAVELFCLEPVEKAMESALQSLGSAKWKCLVGGASKWKRGQTLAKEFRIGGRTILLQAFYEAKTNDGFAIRFEWDAGDLTFAEVLGLAGSIPLPPYIKRPAAAVDSERYQTVFGGRPGSVAAPTAALHFTNEVFQGLTARNVGTAYVTLNVGAGTFKPVKTETIADHQMHGEDFSVDRETLQNIINAERIVAVGTTSLRTLESLYWLGVKAATGAVEDWTLGQWEAYGLSGSVHYRSSFTALLNWMNNRSVERLNCRTSLLIAPGYNFKVPVGLVTNFHQPGSTLLLLVAAFVGQDWRKVYDHALNNNYRFLSYGDSSYLTPGPSPPKM